MASTVLVCPPTFFQIEYEINPWMHVSNKVNHKKAQEEFENLVQIYKRIGLEVLEIKQKIGLPDMVFTANHGFILDKLFIKSNFRYPQRRKESDFAEDYFQKRGFIIKSLPRTVFFEGQGDLLFRDSKFFLGYGYRSSIECKKYLENILETTIISFALNNPFFYHLDTCFAPLGNGKVIINPDAFSTEDREAIKDNFQTVIHASKEDNQVFCCNLIVHNNTVVIGKGISNELKRSLERENFEIIEIEMGEFLKSGGSVKCLTLEFYKT